MKVTLINHSGNEGTAAKAAALCVGNKTDNNKNSFTRAVKSGHYSILEHIIFTFLVEDVSRTLTHQLIRHRLASYSQKSQRYCKLNPECTDWYIIPKSIQENTQLKKEYEKLMLDIKHKYFGFIKAGIPKEDIRYILPNATTTDIIITINARAFIEASTKRLCNRAQWEIRHLFHTMKELIKDDYPTIYSLCVPLCKKTGCIETNSC